MGIGDGGASPPPGKSGTGAPSPSPDKSGTGTGTGIGVSVPWAIPSQRRGSVATVTVALDVPVHVTAAFFRGTFPPQIATRTHEPKLEAVSCHWQVQLRVRFPQVGSESRAATVVLAVGHPAICRTTTTGSPIAMGGVCRLQVPLLQKARKDHVGGGVPKARADCDRWIFGSLDAARAQETAARD